MADSYTYHDYRIDYVYGHTTADQKRRVVDFWRRHRVLRNSQDAARRVDEVVFIAVDEHDRVVGVNTVYIECEPRNHKQYFFYRMFVQPGNRETRLMAFMTGKAFQHLKQLEMADKPAGLVIVAENPKLMRSGMRRYLERHGLSLCGTLVSGHDAQGRDVWIGRW